MAHDIETELDFAITNNGTTVSFRILTEAARDWVTDCVQLEGFRWMGRDVFVVDEHDAGGLANMMAEYGFNVG